MKSMTDSGYFFIHIPFHCCIYLCTYNLEELFIISKTNNAVFRYPHLKFAKKPNSNKGETIE